MRNRLAIVCQLIVVLCFFPTMALAQSEESDGWSWDLAPYYLWAVGLDGEVTVEGMTSNVDLSFGDILDQLEFVADFHLEGRKESWGFLIEPTYIELESEAEGPGGGDSTSTTEILMAEVAGLYRFGSSGTYFDLIYGARYMGIDSELAFEVIPTVSGDQSWVDGMVGGRFVDQFGEKWWMEVRGDVAAGGSDLTWNIYTLLLVDLSEHFALGFGYRHLDIDYEDGDGSEEFRFDASLSGPLVGVNIRF